MKAKDVTFTSPLGETTIKAHRKMVDDLPAWWQLRLQDLMASRQRREMGDMEFITRLTALFTNAEGVAFNRRIDPATLPDLNPTLDSMTSMVEAGTEIFKFIAGGDDSGNASDKN